MLDNLSDGRLEIGVGRGGVMEAYFWGQQADPHTNYDRYCETLAIMREGFSHDRLTYAGRFHWGDLGHEQAMRSIELFTTEVMPRYTTASPPSR
jgi:alkanesulfonate monooxygenase SsuD/methylene tetrahydromethanopterin reductase-like flavin-dependent oxidoreductase (luciferase family)